MRVSLNTKLALSFVLIVALTGVALYFVFTNFNASHFDQFLLDQQTSNMIQQLQSYYQSAGSWDELRKSLIFSPGNCEDGEDCIPNLSDYFSMQLQGGQGQGMGQRAGFGQGAAGQRDGGNNAGDAGRLFGLADEASVIIIANRNAASRVGTVLTDKEKAEGKAIVVDGKTVGILLTVQHLPVRNPAETEFLNKTKQAFAIALVGVIVVAAVLGAIFASGLTKRLKNLTQAATKMSQGEFLQQVPVQGNDEISDLSKAFNSMSDQIETSNRIRKQMTADVAHDLRTPLTVIGGYVESMRDGDLEPTPERFGVIHTEIGHLNQLVEDLRVLSHSDAGELHLNLQTLDPYDLVKQCQAVFANEAAHAGISLVTDSQPGEISIQGDEGRLLQILENLVSNALRYTPEGGSVRIGSSKTSDGKCKLVVADSGKGIPKEELPLIFERFHRVDKSRHTDSNQSGLGLAIVKALVTAHHGEIKVQSELDKGTQFEIYLPL